MQTINIARKSLAQAPDGEFVSHLKISEVMLGAPKPKAKPGAKSNTLSMQLKALFAITLPVTITKGDNLYSKTELSSYKLLPDGNSNWFSNAWATSRRALILPLPTAKTRISAG